MSHHPSVHFFSEGTSYHLPQKDPIKKWIIDSLKNESRKAGNINIICCDDNYLYNLNVEYLNHDYYTDIITFNYNENDIIHSDIYISTDRAGDNAKKYNVKKEKEIHRLIIHGLLHLSGYEDSTEEEKKLMREKEDYYLSLLPG